MSLPDLLKDVNSAGHHDDQPSSVSSTPVLHHEACKPKKMAVSRCDTRSPQSVDFEWESDSVSSLDEGEAAWDALGRMNSIRRSNRFDKPQLLTVELNRTSQGYGLELEGKSPPVIHAVCK